MAENDPNFPHVPAEEVEAVADTMPMGWGYEDVEDPARREAEEWDEMASSGDIVYTMQEQEPIAEELWKKWIDFQKEHGRGEESNDMLLLDKFVNGKDFTYSYQPIGNCVAANSARPWATRSLFQSCFFGGERLGEEEFGYRSQCPSIPAAYGFMRQRGNMRGRGDGGFGSAMAKAYVEDGIIPCSNGELQSIIGGNEKDYPEMSSQKSKYKAFGSWQYNEQLRPHLTCKLEECFKVETLDDLWKAIMKGKPCFVCSSYGWTHGSMHPDGFPIGIRRGTWQHNMGIEGAFTASNGDRIFSWHTLSWARGSEEKWIFYAPWDRDLEHDFRRMDVYAIGQITDLDSDIPTVAA